MTKSLEKKGLFTGLIEQDENGNFFCGEYLLDYKMVVSNFKLGDKITLKPLLQIQAIFLLKLTKKNLKTSLYLI